MMEKAEFALRLAALRMQKGVSARDMSLSLGQSPGYINNIENGVNFPSMAIFFEICDYLGVTPQCFFDMTQARPARMGALLEAVQPLSDEQLDHLIALVRDLRGKGVE